MILRAAHIMLPNPNQLPIEKFAVLTELPPCVLPRLGVRANSLSAQPELQITNFASRDLSVKRATLQDGNLAIADWPPQR